MTSNEIALITMIRECVDEAEAVITALKALTSFAERIANPSQSPEPKPDAPRE